MALTISNINPLFYYNTRQNTLGLIILKFTIFCVFVVDMFIIPSKVFSLLCQTNQQALLGSDRTPLNPFLTLCLTLCPVSQIQTKPCLDFKLNNYVYRRPGKTSTGLKAQHAQLLKYFQKTYRFTSSSTR